MKWKSRYLNAWKADVDDGWNQISAQLAKCCVLVLGVMYLLVKWPVLERGNRCQMRWMLFSLARPYTSLTVCLLLTVLQFNTALAVTNFIENISKKLKRPSSILLIIKGLSDWFTWAPVSSKIWSGKHNRLKNNFWWYSCDDIRSKLSLARYND